MKIAKSPIQSIRRYFAHAAVLGMTTAALGLGISSSAQAQTCRALEDVGGGGVEVTKTVSTFGVLFIRSNWHTDFAVPGGGNFQYFVATILPQEGTTYDIDMNLKYSDDTTDEVFTTRNMVLTEGEPFRIRADSRRGDNPFRINVRVGGTQAEGNTYTVSVSACR